MRNFLLISSISLSLHFIFLFLKKPETQARVQVKNIIKKEPSKEIQYRERQSENASKRTRSEKIIHVILDPGHGGKDRGAVRGSLEEANLNLKVALFLSQLLEKDSHFNVSLTRSSDRFLSLEKRTKIAHEKRGDVFLSLHVNASQDKSAKGGEIYFQNYLPPDEKSMFLAQMEEKAYNESDSLISTSLTSFPQSALSFPNLFKNLKPEVESILADLHRTHKIFLSSLLAKSLMSRGPKETSKKAFRKSSKPFLLEPLSFEVIRQAPFYVISHVNMPSVLVEMGFITNENEARKLRQRDVQKSFAYRIYQGLIRYRESVKVSVY